MDLEAVNIDDRLDANALFDMVREWAEARNLIEGSNPQAQMLKLLEEIGELASAIAKGNVSYAIDGVGDAVVVLTILSGQLGFKVEEALAAACEQIRHRKGQMLNGVFVKESDLLLDTLAGED